jgi:hypothetical protein
MITAIQAYLKTSKDAQTPESRNEALDKAVRRLDLLNRRLSLASVERGRKGGRKTAERGPEYFRRIAAMRKTKAGGRPKKRRESVQI